VALSKEEMRLIAGTLLGPRSLVPGVGERGSKAFVLSGAQALALQGSYVYEVFWRLKQARWPRPRVRRRAPNTGTAWRS